MQKEFALKDVASTVTGYLMGEMIGIHNVVGFMVDGAVGSAVLPEAAEAVRPMIVAQHPFLEEMIRESDRVTTDNVDEVMAEWEGRWGLTVVLRN